MRSLISVQIHLSLIWITDSQIRITLTMLTPVVPKSHHSNKSITIKVNSLLFLTIYSVPGCILGVKFIIQELFKYLFFKYFTIIVFLPTITMFVSSDT